MAKNTPANQNNDVAAKWENEGGKAVTGGGFWKPTKVGDALRGVLVRLRHEQGKYKQSVADIRDKDGIIWALGLSAMLEARITPDMQGTEIGLIYRGVEHSDTTGQDYHLYDVFTF